MCLTEYNETETLELFRQEGRQEGQQETMLLNIRKLMNNTGWSADKIMDMLEIPQNQRKALSIRLGKNCERSC